MVIIFGGRGLGGGYGPSGNDPSCTPGRYAFREPGIFNMPWNRFRGRQRRRMVYMYNQVKSKQKSESMTKTKYQPLNMDKYLERTLDDIRASDFYALGDMPDKTNDVTRSRKCSGGDSKTWSYPNGASRIDYSQAFDNIMYSTDRNQSGSKASAVYTKVSKTPKSRYCLTSPKTSPPDFNDNTSSPRMEKEKALTRAKKIRKQKYDIGEDVVAMDKECALDRAQRLRKKIEGGKMKKVNVKDELDVEIVEEEALTDEAELLLDTVSDAFIGTTCSDDKHILDSNYLHEVRMEIGKLEDLERTHREAQTKMDKTMEGKINRVTLAETLLWEDIYKGNEEMEKLYAKGDTGDQGNITAIKTMKYSCLDQQILRKEKLQRMKQQKNKMTGFKYDLHNGYWSDIGTLKKRIMELKKEEQMILEKRGNLIKQRIAKDVVWKKSVEEELAVVKKESIPLDPKEIKRIDRVLSRTAEDIRLEKVSKAEKRERKEKKQLTKQTKSYKEMLRKTNQDFYTHMEIRRETAKPEKSEDRQPRPSIGVFNEEPISETSLNCIKKQNKKWGKLQKQYDKKAQSIEKKQSQKAKWQKRIQRLKLLPSRCRAKMKWFIPDGKVIRHYWLGKRDSLQKSMTRAKKRFGRSLALAKERGFKTKLSLVLRKCYTRVRIATSRVTKRIGTRMLSFKTKMVGVKIKMKRIKKILRKHTERAGDRMTRAGRKTDKLLNKCYWQYKRAVYPKSHITKPIFNFSKSAITTKIQGKNWVARYCNGLCLIIRFNKARMFNNDSILKRVVRDVPEHQREPLLVGFGKDRFYIQRQNLLRKMLEQNEPKAYFDVADMWPEDMVSATSRPQLHQPDEYMLGRMSTMTESDKIKEKLSNLTPEDLTCGKSTLLSSLSSTESSSEKGKETSEDPNEQIVILKERVRTAINTHTDPTESIRDLRNYYARIKSTRSPAENSKEMVDDSSTLSTEDLKQTQKKRKSKRLTKNSKTASENSVKSSIKNIFGLLKGSKKKDKAEDVKGKHHKGSKDASSSSDTESDIIDKKRRKKRPKSVSRATKSSSASSDIQQKPVTALRKRKTDNKRPFRYLIKKPLVARKQTSSHLVKKGNRRGGKNEKFRIFVKNDRWDRGMSKRRKRFHSHTMDGKDEQSEKDKPKRSFAKTVFGILRSRKSKKVRPKSTKKSTSKKQKESKASRKDKQKQSKTQQKSKKKKDSYSTSFVKKVAGKLRSTKRKKPDQKTTAKKPRHYKSKPGKFSFLSKRTETQQDSDTTKEKASNVSFVKKMIGRFSSNKVAKSTNGSKVRKKSGNDKQNRSAAQGLKSHMATGKSKQRKLGYSVNRSRWRNSIGFKPKTSKPKSLNTGTTRRRSRRQMITSVKRVQTYDKKRERSVVQSAIGLFRSRKPRKRGSESSTESDSKHPIRRKAQTLSMHGKNRRSTSGRFVNRSSRKAHERKVDQNCSTDYGDLVSSCENILVTNSQSRKNNKSKKLSKKSASRKGHDILAGYEGATDSNLSSIEDLKDPSTESKSRKNFMKMFKLKRKQRGGKEGGGEPNMKDSLSKTKRFSRRLNTKTNTDDKFSSSSSTSQGNRNNTGGNTEHKAEPKVSNEDMSRKVELYLAELRERRAAEKAERARRKDDTGDETERKRSRKQRPELFKCKISFKKKKTKDVKNERSKDDTKEDSVIDDNKLSSWSSTSQTRGDTGNLGGQSEHVVKPRKSNDDLPEKKKPRKHFLQTHQFGRRKKSAKAEEPKHKDKSIQLKTMRFRGSRHSRSKDNTRGNEISSSASYTSGVDVENTEGKVDHNVKLIKSDEEFPERKMSRKRSIRHFLFDRKNKREKDGKTKSKQKFDESKIMRFRRSRRSKSKDSIKVVVNPSLSATPQIDLDNETGKPRTKSIFNRLKSLRSKRHHKSSTNHDTTSDDKLPSSSSTSQADWENKKSSESRRSKNFLRIFRSRRESQAELNPASGSASDEGQESETSVKLTHVAKRRQAVREIVRAILGKEPSSSSSKSPDSHHSSPSRVDGAVSLGSNTSPGTHRDNGVDTSWQVVDIDTSEQTVDNDTSEKSVESSSSWTTTSSSGNEYRPRIDDIGKHKLRDGGHSVAKRETLRDKAVKFFGRFRKSSVAVADKNDSDGENNDRRS